MPSEFVAVADSDPRRMIIAVGDILVLGSSLVEKESENKHRASSVTPPSQASQFNQTWIGSDSNTEKMLSQKHGPCAGPGR